MRFSAPHLLLLAGAALAAALFDKRADNWVDVWTNAPLSLDGSKGGGYFLPPYVNGLTILPDTTIRQIVHLTLASTNVRLQIYNEFGPVPLPVSAMTVASVQPQSGTGFTAGVQNIIANTSKTVTVNGQSSFTVEAGQTVLSDPITLAQTIGPGSTQPVASHGDLSISMWLQNGISFTNPSQMNFTGHQFALTFSWFLQGKGDQTGAANFGSSTSEQHWFFIEAVQANIAGAKTFVALGDSITDGINSDPTKSDRWTDDLFDNLQTSSSTSNIAVANKGIGGNCVTNTHSTGPPAISRYQSDVIDQPGVVYAFLFEGINDIGRTPSDATSQQEIGDWLIGNYTILINAFHQAGLKAWGGTITPFHCNIGLSGSADCNGYALGDNPSNSPNSTREATRTRVNTWIRANYDFVADFDAAIRNASYPSQMQDQYWTGDMWLHPNAAGYQAMAAMFNNAPW